MSTEREIYIYNTLTRRKERFEPRTPGEVSIYVCGVTPYDHAHIGHARPSIFFDVLRKFFREMGFRVTLVQNFTDIADTIIDRARERGMEPLELARHYSEAYLEAMDRLGVERADVYPKVSEHIDAIIEMIQGLIEKGAAYESQGSVFFRVDAFPEYGKLSNQRKEELMAGARIEVDEAKEDHLDFALWKRAKPGEPSWPSPWGPGRPGWHIECSAMSLKYLGNSFDIHGGGLDLIFPHHENEIAQSEAYTGEAPFVRYWIHNGLVTMGDEKMSKSLGNFVTVDAVLQEYHPTFVRYAVLQHHYRSPMEFSKGQLETMKRGWQRLNRAYQEMLEISPPLSVERAREQGAPEELLAAVKGTQEKFLRAMADDFNTALALASLFELIRDVRPYLAGASSASAGEKAGIGAALAVLQRLGAGILGVLTEDDVDEGAARDGASDELVRGLVELVLEIRANARKAKDFATADHLRSRLQELGIVVEDRPEGTRWSFKG